MKRSMQRGFTLIELMVVVAVVAVLAAVALPSYKDYNIRSKWASILSDIDGLKTAIKVCLNDNASDGNSCGSLAQLQNHGFAGSVLPKPKYAQDINMSPAGQAVNIWFTALPEAGGYIYGGSCSMEASGNLACVKFGGDNVPLKIMKDNYR